MKIGEALGYIIGNKYALSAIFLAILVILLIFLLYFLRIYLNKKLKRAVVNSKTVIRLEIPLMILGVVLGAEIVLNKILYASGSVASILGNINSTLIIVSITYALMIIGDLIIHSWSIHLVKSRKTNSHEEIIPLFKSIINIVLFIAGFLFVLQVWNIKITAILTSLGVIGVILGFVYKETLSNTISGISMILDDVFKKGDMIELSDGEIGFIEEINLRSTKIRNFDSEEIIVPNSMLSNMKIKNYAHPSKTIRVKIQVSVAYGSNIEKFEKLVLSLLSKKHEILKFPKPKVTMSKMGEYALEYNVHFFISDFHHLFSVKSEMTRLIYLELKKNNIDIPFPSRTIYRGK